MTSRRPISLPNRLAACWAAFCVVATGLFAASPAAHEWLHDHEHHGHHQPSHSGGGDCAVQHYSAGKFNSVTPTSFIVPGVIAFHPRLPVDRDFVPAFVFHRLPPGRAPPVA